MLIDRLAVKKFGCLKDVDISLTPLQAFIGPNDSGKSTILLAAHILGLLGWGREQEVREFGPELWTTFVNRSTENSTELIAISKSGYCSLVQTTRQGTKNAAVRYLGPLKDQADKSNYRQGLSSSLGGIEFNHSKIKPDFAETSFATQQGVRMVRLNPDSLREPSGLIPQDELIQLKSEHGVGLAGVYDAIRDRDVDTFIGIQEQIRKLFDGVDKLQLKAISEDKKILQVRLTTGEEIPANQMSEGLLYTWGSRPCPTWIRSRCCSSRNRRMACIPRASARWCKYSASCLKPPRY
jgi:hypothetical protein